MRGGPETKERDEEVIDAQQQHTLSKNTTHGTTNQDHKLKNHCDQAQGRTSKQHEAMMRLRQELGAMPIGGVEPSFSEMECQCNREGKCSVVSKKKKNEDDEDGERSSK